MATNCGHACCDTRDDSFHDHFLPPERCPMAPDTAPNADQDRIPDTAASGDDWPVTKIGEGVDLPIRDDAPKGLFHEPDTAAHCVPVRRNINESVPRDWTEQELRGGALRDALSYFTYVTSRAPVTGPAQPPVGITTVLEIADHFAAYVRDGSKPQKEATDGN